ncbi:hypothetical protein AAHB34_16045 [Paenarthrobacter ureafaciens]
MSDDDNESVRDRMAKNYRVGKLSLGRFAELQAAEEEGRDIGASDDERAEYERMKPKWSAMSKGILDAYNASSSIAIDYKAMMDRLNEIVGPVYDTKTAPFSPAVAQQFTDQSREADAHFRAYEEEAAAARRDELDRETRNSTNIQVTAEVLRDLLEAMRQEHAKAQDRDVEARASAKKNYEVAKWSMIFAGLALAAVIVIELIKMWS